MDLQHHNIDSKEWNNTLSSKSHSFSPNVIRQALMRIPAKRLKMQDYAVIYAELINEDTTEEIIGEVLKRVKVVNFSLFLILISKESNFLYFTDSTPAIIAIVEILCEEKYYNVTQKYIQDIYEIVTMMAKANIIFNGNCIISV